MDELRLRRIFLGLLESSLLLSAAGCGGAAQEGPLLGAGNDLDREQQATADAGSGGAGSGGSDAGSVSIAGSAGMPGVSFNGQPEPFWPDLDISEFVAPPCDSPVGWRATAGLNPAFSMDYVALRVKNWRPDEIDATGSACATASDVPACEQALTDAVAGVTLNQLCGGPPSGCQHYLIGTAGDRVEVWSSPEELLRFLGPIDTPAEALLRVYQGTFMGYEVTCGNPGATSVRTVSDGYDVVVTRMTDDCSPIVTRRYLLHVGRDGSVTELRNNVWSVIGACVGRRPEGLLARSECAAAEHVLGTFFAGISHLEAASVTAFERLETELEAFGAPLTLREQARRAAADEVRHAAQTQRVAESFGARVAPPVVETLGPRDLEAIACENIAEGCVRETYGALVAHHQAQHAREPELRNMMRGIAEDETRHAALAWRVAAWVEPRLSAAARERVRAARERALAQLRAELGASVPAELCEVAGVPSPSAALELFAGLERLLWQPAELGAPAALS